MSRAVTPSLSWRRTDQDQEIDRNRRVDPLFLPELEVAETLSIMKRGWWGPGCVAVLGGLLATEIQAADERVPGLVSRAEALTEASVPSTNRALWDASFKPGVHDGQVFALAIQTDGAIWAGGTFDYMKVGGGQGLVRLQPDAREDYDFLPPAQGTIFALILTPDDGLVIGGMFRAGNPQQEFALGRIRPDNSWDTRFNLEANSLVQCLALQPDGRILVGGYFTVVRGQPRRYLCRLLPDGTLDPEFHPQSDGPIESIALQLDGRILVGGQFTTLAGEGRNHVARLLPEGALDPSFHADTDREVTCVAVQPNGQILVGGLFSMLGGVPRSRLGRLESDGSVDLAFDPAPNGLVESIAFQSDGRFLVSSFFSAVNGAPRANLARLLPDGSLDPEFNPGTDGPAPALALQDDGKVLVGGFFNVLAGESSPRLGRLLNTESATESLSFDDHSITWLRGGTTPDFWRSTFDVSTNGLDWLSLGPGKRMAVPPGDPRCGWKLTGLELPPGACVRARGVVVGGRGGGCSWIVERLVGGPGITSMSRDTTVDAGSLVLLEVQAGGTPPFTYAWYRDGIALTNDMSISGTTSAALQLSGLLGSEQGGYSVVIANSLGSVTSRLANLVVHDPVMVKQAVSLRQDLGQPARLAIAARGTNPLFYQWWHDGVAVPNGHGEELVIASVDSPDAGDYLCTVSNRFGVVTSDTVSLSVNRAILDPDFHARPDGIVRALAVLPDGMILVGGDFRDLNGQPCNGLGRLRGDGSFAADFGANANYNVLAVAVREDGGIYAAGPRGGGSRDHAVRYFADGTRDAGFNADPVYSVTCWALQEDGLPLGGGGNRLAPFILMRRFLSDGSADPSFASLQVGGSIETLAVQPDRRILVGGVFRHVELLGHTNLARLYPDGTLDANFTPNIGADVLALALQADGRILVGGRFPGLPGAEVAYLGRLLPDGTPDASFSPVFSAMDVGRVASLVVQTDGQILVAGDFQRMGGVIRNGLGRLLPDGRVDLTFDPGANGPVESLALQADGRVIVGGQFTMLAGRPCTNLGRLRNPEPAQNVLRRDGSTIAWQRSGASPEVGRTQIDISTNGTEWVALGAGERVPGGWAFRVADLPPTASIRARGFVSGGQGNGSTWFVERLVGPPTIIRTPLSRTNDAGSSVIFEAAVDSGSVVDLRWLKNGEPLSDGDGVSGADTPALTLARVFGADRGDYSLRASNAGGTTLSPAAHLTVHDPFIPSPTSSARAEPGQDAVFHLAVVGTEPLTYQWVKAGSGLPLAQTAELRLTQVRVEDAGTYLCVVSNQFGREVDNVMLSVNGVSPDDPFAPIVAAGPMDSGIVETLLPQPDGKIILGGYFSSIGGERRINIGRLNPDGTLDTEFRSDTEIGVWQNAQVNAVALQVDGRILVGGRFTTVAGQSRSNLCRLWPDGALDAGFNCQTDGAVENILVRPDGKILLSGGFTHVNGETHVRVARVWPDGAVDRSFLAGVNESVRAIALGPNGSVLLAGSIYAANGTACGPIVRLLENGDLDPTFAMSADVYVRTMALQPDGKILFSGGSSGNGGKIDSGLIRLLPDGTFDTTFHSPSARGITALALQADGGIIVGGQL
jgi:uncharacterized delta-60 repeat protein